jgi:hypothetical protein
MAGDDDDEEPPDEESMYGLTMVKGDGAEMGPNERINFPIVYNLHSNFLTLHKNDDTLIFDTSLQKCIQGANGPFAINRP